MKTISIYQVDDTPLGSGGMGRVLSGRDPQGHPVAIKEILPEFASDFEIRTRTEREVEILQILNNTDNIVKVYDRFPLGNNFYIVMELVDGVNVEQYIQKYGAMTYQRATAFMIKILETLQSVHEKNIVHRDMKPSNIMIRNDERICILDFGIAKELGVPGATGTIVGTIIGSDGYMSPEQADGFSIDHRADIYALGCVLYFMLTGHHAYNTLGSDFETREEIVNKPFPRLSEHSKAAFPTRLQEVLDRATDKNMMRRYQSCREFRKDLESLLTGQSTHISSKNKSTDILVTVGREDCDIIMGNDDQMRVSRHHLDIVYKEFTGGRYYVITDHSSNGTLVNGRDLHRNESENIPADGTTPAIYLARDMNYPLNWEQVKQLIALKLKEQAPDDDASGETIYPKYGPGVEPDLDFDDGEDQPLDNETFTGCVKLFFTRAFDFRGRSRRKEYWYAYLFNVLVFVGIGILVGVGMTVNENLGYVMMGLGGLYGVAFYVMNLSLTIRRLHDTGRSWYVLLWGLTGLIPFVGIIASLVFSVFMIICMCTDSYSMENEWGPCPKN